MFNILFYYMKYTKNLEKYITSMYNVVYTWT